MAPQCEAAKVHERNSSGFWRLTPPRRMFAASGTMELVISSASAAVLMGKEGSVHEGGQRNTLPQVSCGQRHRLSPLRRNVGFKFAAAELGVGHLQNAREQPATNLQAECGAKCMRKRKHGRDADARGGEISTLR